MRKHFYFSISQRTAKTISNFIKTLLVAAKIAILYHCKQMVSAAKLPRMGYRYNNIYEKYHRYFPQIKNVKINVDFRNVVVHIMSSKNRVKPPPLITLIQSFQVLN